VAHLESCYWDGRVPHPSRSLRRVGYAGVTLKPAAGLTEVTWKNLRLCRRRL